MKRLILAVALLGLLVSAASGFVVEGSLHGIGNVSGLTTLYVYAVPASLDTFYVTLMLWFPPFYRDSTYEFRNMQANSYLLFAYHDLNVNFMPDLDEPRGFYGDQIPEFLVVDSDTDDVDITIHPPNSGGFSGQVTYDGSSVGQVFVFAYHNPNFEGLPAGAGFVFDTTGTGNYMAFVDSFGTYYAYAFMDLNRNLTHDSDEPYGVYGGETPAPIVIEPTSFPDDVNITLYDPSAIDPPTPLTVLTISLGEAYPNPFNSSAVIPFSLSAPSELELALFDILGQRVMTLARGQWTAGDQRVTLSADHLPAGLYIVRLQTPSQVVARRLLLLR